MTTKLPPNVLVERGPRAGYDKRVAEMRAKLEPDEVLTEVDSLSVRRRMNAILAAWATATMPKLPAVPRSRLEAAENGSALALEMFATAAACELLHAECCAALEALGNVPTAYQPVLDDAMRPALQTGSLTTPQAKAFFSVSTWPPWVEGPNPSASE